MALAVRAISAISAISVISVILVIWVMAWLRSWRRCWPWMWKSSQLMTTAVAMNPVARAPALAAMMPLESPIRAGSNGSCGMRARDVTRRHRGAVFHVGVGTRGRTTALSITRCQMGMRRVATR